MNAIELRDQLLEAEAERDRYREALERIYNVACWYSLNPERLPSEDE